MSCGIVLTTLIDVGRPTVIMGRTSPLVLGPELYKIGEQNEQGHALMHLGTTDIMFTHAPVTFTSMQ